jgi:hypothetical protein
MTLLYLGTLPVALRPKVRTLTMLDQNDQWYLEARPDGALLAGGPIIDLLPATAPWETAAAMGGALVGYRWECPEHGHNLTRNEATRGFDCAVPSCTERLLQIQVFADEPAGHPKIVTVTNTVTETLPATEATARVEACALYTDGSDDDRNYKPWWPNVHTPVGDIETAGDLLAWLIDYGAPEEPVGETVDDDDEDEDDDYD